MPTLSNRTADFTDSVIRRMTRISNKYGAAAPLQEAAVTGLKFGDESDLEFCEVLARDVGVGAVPSSSFFKEPENRYICLHFTKKNDTLNETLNRLADIRKKIKL